MRKKRKSSKNSHTILKIKWDKMKGKEMNNSKSKRNITSKMKKGGKKS